MACRNVLRYYRLVGHYASADMSSERYEMFIKYTALDWVRWTAQQLYITRDFRFKMLKFVVSWVCHGVMFHQGPRLFSG